MTSERATAIQADTEAAPAKRPKLVYFYSPRSGRCRRVEGFLAQVLQRGHNHNTFDLVRVPVEKRPDLAERFRITDLPTLLLIHERKVQLRIISPTGCRDLERQLWPWLHRAGVSQPVEPLPADPAS